MTSSVPDFKSVGETDQTDGDDDEMGLSTQEKELFKVCDFWMINSLAIFKIYLERTNLSTSLRNFTSIYGLVMKSKKQDINSEITFEKVLFSRLFRLVLPLNRANGFCKQGKKWFSSSNKRHYTLKRHELRQQIQEFFTNSPQYKNANIGNFILAVP